ncbi:DUF3261 domain-containing protein, partial [Pantoea agglomerans]
MIRAALILLTALLLSADEQQIDLAGLSSVGIRLFSLRYDASGIHTQQLMPLP